VANVATINEAPLMMLLLENIGVVFVISWPPDDRSDKHELLDSKEGRKQKAPHLFTLYTVPKKRAHKSGHLAKY
jgi:hypothetical protein